MASLVLCIRPDEIRNAAKLAYPLKNKNVKSEKKDGQYYSDILSKYYLMLWKTILSIMVFNWKMD